MLVSVNVCEGKAVLGMGAGMKRITIKDIAKVAGVSYATVSRALNGSPEIGEDTRERILRLCKEMGYTTNYVARSMVMRRMSSSAPSQTGEKVVRPCGWGG